MQVSVVGAGYVGLVTAACLAKLGNDVTCVDRDADRVARLRRGELPIREPGLDGLVAAGVAAGRLRFESDAAATRGTTLVIVAVGTLDASGEWTDGIVRAAVDDLARDPDAPRWIVIRSTLMPGTAVSIARTAADVDPRVEVAVNPEFTREATAVADFLMPDRVVVGVTDPHDAERHGADGLVDHLRRLYAPLDAPLVVTDLTSAETIKVASNVFLATKITFANELARLCAATGADVGAVVDGIGLDKRIGRSFLSPGPGYGGSCLPSQARALPALGHRHGVTLRMMDAVAGSNEDQSEWFLDRLEAIAERPLEGRRVALLGLTFKAGTDDLRESPALRLADGLVRRGARVVAFDPIATGAAVAELASRGVVIEAAPDALAATAGADVVVVGTEWPEFRQLDWAAAAARMTGDLVGDARHVVDVAAATRAGLRVVVLGVPARRSTPPLMATAALPTSRPSTA